VRVNITKTTGLTKHLEKEVRGICVPAK